MENDPPSRPPAPRAPPPSYQPVPRPQVTQTTALPRPPAQHNANSPTAATSPGTPIPVAPPANPAPRPAARAPSAGSTQELAPVQAAATNAVAPSSSPGASAQSDEDEARRLLVKFSASHSASKPPASAGAALLEQLGKLLTRAGLQVTRNPNGTMFISDGRAETVLLFEDGLFGTIKRDRKSFPALPIAWNPFEKKFEGTQPEREAGATEAEFRVPRRSALAVLTETVLGRLSAGDEK